MNVKEVECLTASCCAPPPDLYFYFEGGRGKTPSPSLPDLREIPLEEYLDRTSDYTIYFISRLLVQALMDGIEMVLILVFSYF